MFTPTWVEKMFTSTWVEKISHPPATRFDEIINLIKACSTFNPILDHKTGLFEYKIWEKIQHDFPKMRRGSTAVWNFPKNHLFWCSHNVPHVPNNKNWFAVVHCSHVPHPVVWGSSTAPAKGRIMIITIKNHDFSKNLPFFGENSDFENCSAMETTPMMIF